MTARVAIDVTPMLYTANGIGRCTRSLVEALLDADSGVDFTLFGRRFGGAALRDLGLKARTVHLRMPRRAEKLIQRLGLFERACRADLYHSTDFYSPLRYPHRAIATIHDVIFIKNPEAVVDHARLARWVGQYARECRAIITSSQWCKRDIVEVFDVDPQRVHVIYWGVDRKTFHPEIDRDALAERLRAQLGITRPYFLTVSCSTGRKNTPRLLRAYAKLTAGGATNDLVAVWDPPRELRAEFESQIVSGRMRFTGRICDALLRDLYAGATAMIYPSLHEGFGLPMLEAMSCGTPVIASSASCLPEVAGDGAVYVDPEDEEAIAIALGRFEEGLWQRENLGERALNRAASFTWDRCARETLEVYRTALSE